MRQKQPANDRDLRATSEARPLFWQTLGRVPALANCRSGPKNWRRGRDSNPRYGCPYAAFRVRCIQPLCHLSAKLATRHERCGAVSSGEKDGTQGRDRAARSKLPPELAVERIRPTAAQRDGEADQAPHQRVFVAAPGPGE